MTHYDTEIMATFRAVLADRVGADKYEVWFGSSVDFALHDQTLRISVADSFFQNWLKSNFRDDLDTVAQQVFGKLLPLEFRVDAELGKRSTKTPVTSAAPSSSAQALAIPQVAPAANSPASAPATSIRRQALLLSDFVEGETNKIAYASTQLAVAQPGRMSPLVIYGPNGVGKSHLLEGACASFRQQRRGSAIYLTAEQFTAYFLEALNGGGLPSFRRKYRDLGMLAVDDIQFLSRKRATINELVHTIDTISRQGGQILLACDEAPAAIRELGPELVSRMAGGMICAIESPSFETRKGIVESVAGRLRVELCEEVVEVVAAQFGANARELTGAVKRLAVMEHALAEAITPAAAEAWLDDLRSAAEQPVRLADIQKVVCEEFGIEAQSLASTRKDKGVSHARMLAMWLARKHTRAALTEIGRFFGGRSHSTVVAAQKKVTGWIAGGDAVHMGGQTRCADDVVRKLQQRLRIA